MRTPALSTARTAARALIVLGCLVLLPTPAEAKRSWGKIARGIQRHQRGALTPLRSSAPRLGLSKKKLRKHKKVRWETGGGVVLDLTAHKVLLIRSRKERKEGTNGWTLPKGKIDAGESRRQATLRETFEETGGLQVEVVGKIARYRSPKALRHYYLMTAQPEQVQQLDERRRARKSKDLPKKRRYLDDHRETLDAKWVSLKKAKHVLQRERDLQVLKAAKQALVGLERSGSK